MIKSPVYQNDQEVIDLIREARQEITEAYDVFNLMVEPELIEYAIFKIRAAEKRFSYLLKWARENKVNLYDPDNNEGLNRKVFSLSLLPVYKSLTTANLVQSPPLPPPTTRETGL